MNINIQNPEEAKDYIEEKKSYIIAELLFYQLMKEPELIREKLFDMLIEKRDIDTKE